MQNCNWPLCVSGRKPAAFAFLIRAADGPDLSAPAAGAVVAPVAEEVVEEEVVEEEVAEVGEVAGVGEVGGVTEVAAGVALDVALGSVEDC